MRASNTGREIYSEKRSTQVYIGEIVQEFSFGCVLSPVVTKGQHWIDHTSTSAQRRYSSRAGETGVNQTAYQSLRQDQKPYWSAQTIAGATGHACPAAALCAIAIRCL